MATALLPEFVVGEPLNGGLWNGVPYCVGIPQPCRDVNKDYSGGDPNIQFPRGYHVNVGAGRAAQMGRYHQTLSAFEPDRVVVKPMFMADGTVQNIVQVMAGRPGRHGAAEITRPLDTPINWASGQTVKLVAEFMPTNVIKAFLFDNIELRGMRNDNLPPDQVHKEPSLVMGVSFSEKKHSAYWWHDRAPNAEISSRKTYTEETPLLVNRWHRLAVSLTPDAHTLQWTLKLRLKIAQPGMARRWKTIWSVDSVSDAPNGILEVRSIMFGNEHSLYKNETGGEWLYRKMQVVV